MLDESQVITERETAAIVLLDPLRRQIESFALIEPGLIGSQIKPEVVDHLARGSKLKRLSFNTLLFYLSHPDEVDAATRLEPGASPKVAQQSLALWQERNIERWRSQTVQLPEVVRNDDDHFTFLLKLSPYRPGQGPLFNEVGVTFAFAGLEAAFIHYGTLREAITGLTPSANQALGNAAKEAVRRAKTTEQKNQVAQTFLRAITAQEKWSVLGEGFKLEPLTANLLALMPAVASPETSSQILAGLFRRGERDAPVIAYSVNQPLGIGWSTINQQVKTYVQTCLAIDRQATETALLNHLHRFDWSSFFLTDLIVSLPEMSRGIIPVAGGKLNYFGRDYLDLPADAATAFQISPDLLALRNKEGKAVGVVRADLAVSPPEVKEIKTGFIPLENFQFSRERRSIETNQAFLEAYPDLVRKLAETLKTEINPAVYPLVSVFELWRYLEGHPQEQEREAIFGFLKEYGNHALFSFLISAYGQENIPLLLKFAREAQVPREREVEGIPTIRLWESFPEELLKEYSILSFFSYDIACRITAEPEKRLQIQDQILRRAKAMTMAAAKLHTQKGALSKEDHLQIQMCFNFYHIYLRAWSAPEDGALQELGIPRKLLEHFLKYHDLADPDVASLFHAAQELWFRSWAKRQEHYAPYINQMAEINGLFYEAYQELEKDSEKTTADPPIEKARVAGTFDRAFATGIFSEEKSPQGIRVLSLCCGTGFRVDEATIQHLIEKGYPIAWPYQGIEYLAKGTAPDHMEIIQGDLLEILGTAEHEEAYDQIIDIWPGIPGADAFVLTKLEKSIELVARSLKKDGLFVIDIPFPYGAHSCAEAIQEYHRKHLAETVATGVPPYEPPGMLFKSFPREGKPPIGKGFYAFDPEDLVALMKKYGLSTINLWTDGETRKRVYDAVQKDDSNLQRWRDPFSHPIWQTQSQWNRMTIIGYKGELPEEIRRKLPKAVDLSETNREQL